MPPKSKERKKVARVVPAKAKKREGFQSSSSSAMARSSGGQPEKKKRQRPECSYPYCESLAYGLEEFPGQWSHSCGPICSLYVPAAQGKH